MGEDYRSSKGGFSYRAKIALVLWNLSTELCEIECSEPTTTEQLENLAVGEGSSVSSPESKIRVALKATCVCTDSSMMFTEAWIFSLETIAAAALDALLQTEASSMEALRNLTIPQYNARLHVAPIVRSFLDAESVRLLPWPARSHVLSPKETFWSMFVVQLARNHTPVTTVDDLWHDVAASWASVPVHAIQSLTQFPGI
ncbi:hypothetical protein TNCV_4936461 [Trichonephila clavipes]|nr:hypothetical protein TNCV_4936461 [Trichonephila clavipes]